MSHQQNQVLTIKFDVHEVHSKGKLVAIKHAIPGNIMVLFIIHHARSWKF